MLAFGWQFKRFTGITFHDVNQTLLKVTADLVPNFTVEKLKVTVKGKQTDQYCLKAMSIIDVVNSQVWRLFDNNLLQLSPDLVNSVEAKSLLLWFGG